MAVTKSIIFQVFFFSILYKQNFNLGTNPSQKQILKGLIKVFFVHCNSYSMGLEIRILMIANYIKIPNSKGLD